MNLSTIFEAYGEDPAAALEAFANLDPQAWSDYNDRAAERQYRAEYRAWVRSQKAQLLTESQQVKLFGDSDVDRIVVRERLVTKRDGERQEHDTFALAGAEGAAILREVIERDSKGAKTTLARTTALRKLADELERRSKAEGRPVSVAEVLGLEAA